MNAIVIRGRMNQLRGTFKTRWCKMTGNRLGQVGGRMLKLAGRVQVTYGRTTSAAGKRMRKMTGL